MRAVLFAFTADLIPLYALYALLFAAHGLSAAQISSLLALWSATSFVLEIPSGAWADTVSRRGLLILSGALLAGGFLAWTLYPAYLGFAAGFILWGASGSLRSGTFEALIYDDLTARTATRAYPRLMGDTRAAAESAALLGILAAAPLYALGGYALVAWSSVGMATLHTLTAVALPSTPKSVSAADVEELAEARDQDDAADRDGNSGRDNRSTGTSADEPAPAGLGGAPTTCIAGGAATGMAVSQPNSTGYFALLRAGLREALKVRMIRRGVVLVALLSGMTAFDEYFALLADHAGAGPALAAILVGVTVAGALAGSLLAGRTEDMRTRTMAVALAVAGMLFIGGTLLAGSAAHHPAALYVLAAVGFSAVGVAYGIDYNADVIASARLQDAITGPARATVTSVSGFATEVVALLVFAFAALTTSWLPIPTMVALLGIPLLLAAALVPTWLPRRGVGSTVVPEPSARDAGAR